MSRLITGGAGLAAGLLIGALIAVILHDPAPVAPAPVATQDRAGADGEAARLRAERDSLRAELQKVHGQEPEPTPAGADSPAKEAPKPGPTPTEPATEPAKDTAAGPVPHAEAAPVEPEAALRAILGRAPLREEIEALATWRARSVPTQEEINAQAQAGNAAEVLRMVTANRDARLGALLADEGTRTRLFRRSTPDVHFSLQRLEAGEAIPDGAVIELPAGVHKIDTSKYRTTMPRDVLIRGAGKDSTLLSFSESLGAGKGMLGLHLEDLTLDSATSNGAYLTDLRTVGPTTISASRVRFVRFDAGLGNSVLVSGRNVLFYAADCEFTAGFGRMPTSGTPFGSLGVLVVHAENSTFAGPFSRIASASLYRPNDSEELYGQVECQFVNCRFVDCIAQEKKDVFIKLTNCTTVLNQPEGATNWDDLSDERKLGAIRAAAYKREPRPLSELNRDWPAK